MRCRGARLIGVMLCPLLFPLFIPLFIPLFLLAQRFNIAILTALNKRQMGNCQCAI